MIFEPFAIGDSLMHRLDPRIKLVSAAAFSVTVAVLGRFSALGTAILMAALILALARLPLTGVARQLLAVAGFLALLWVVLPFSHAGPPLFRIGPLTGTQSGVILAARISLKSLAIVMALIALTATMPVATLGHAMDRLRVPTKLTHLLLLCYRYIFVLYQEYQRLQRAAKIRGFCPGTNLHTYRTYAYLVGMLFVRAEARAQRVLKAMRCRGFQGRFYSLQVFSPHPADRAFAAVAGLAVIALIALEWEPWW